MAIVAIGRHAKRAALHRIEHQAAHLLQFRSGRFALDGLFAHGVVTHRNMTDQTADIDADFAL